MIEKRIKTYPKPRLISALSLLANADADVVCLQEVDADAELLIAGDRHIRKAYCRSLLASHFEANYDRPSRSK